jgi:tetraacyldisaccharide 4'-kinase
VDLVVVNGVMQHPSLIPTVDGRHLLQMSLVPGDAVSLDGRAPPRSLERFRGQPLHAVAGIGNPARFFRDLRDCGLSIIEHPFPDHHPFAAEDLQFADELPVLMTEKDAVKCHRFANPRLWYMPVDAAFGEAHERELLESVMRKLDCLSVAGE